MKYFLLLIVLFLIACAKIEIEENPLYFFWNEMDRKYVYFNEKQVDWDSVRNTLHRYNPDIKSDLVSGFTNMVLLLRDRHVWINTGEENITYSLGDYFFSSIDINFYSSGKFEENDTYCIAQLAGGVVYIEIKTFYASFVDFEKTVKRYDYSNGIIMDIRHNGGGFYRNAFELASNFISGEHTVLYQKFKTGAGHNDFTDFKPMALKGFNRFPNVKIILLIDRMTYSTANGFASIMKNFTNTVLVGDKTGGGGGISARGILPNGWSYSISENALFDMNYQSLENGLLPDYQVIFDKERYEQEKPRHNQLDFAYKLLLGKH